MKTVIIGANGVIGNALFNEFSAQFPNCVGLTTKNNPRLKTVKYDFAALREYLSGADVVIYCVGVSKFAECEEFPEKSLFLNVSLPHEILKNLSGNQSFIYFSSPIAIYDFGDSPVFNYALHKRMAEEQLQQENALIVRPSKVIESAGIIGQWKSALSEGKKISAFFDQSIAPVNTALLCDQLLKLIRGKCSGAYNFSAGDSLSYLDMAKAICAYYKLDAGLIERKSARDNNPFFFEQDVLDCSAAQKATGYVPPFSGDIVNKYLQELT